MEQLGLQVLQRVRDSLEARGSKTIRSLGRTFRELDSYNGDSKVDRDEFIVGLRENGVNLSKNEFEVKKHGFLMILWFF